MAHEEKIRLLRTAAIRPEWQIVRCAAILALNTTLRGCELKGLRWRDVNLIDRVLTVRRSKTEAGERVVRLTPMQWLYFWNCTSALKRWVPRS